MLRFVGNISMMIVSTKWQAGLAILLSKKSWTEQMAVRLWWYGDMAYCNKTPTTSIHLSYLLPSPNVSTFFLESACSITFHESATVDGSETLRSPVGRRSCFSGIYRFLYIPGGAGFLNHPQYHPCDLVFLFHLFRWTSLIQHQVTAKVCQRSMQINRELLAF